MAASLRGNLVRSIVSPALSALMHHVSPPEFETDGEVVEFLMTLQGKWRLVLRTGTGDLHLKITKSLRSELRAMLQPGMRVSVRGFEERKRFATQPLLTITDCLVLSPHSGDRGIRDEELVCASCPIEVCAKKNCWKNGGKVVYETLCRELDTAGLGEHVKVKKVGCLDNCKRGPNVLHGKTLHERCSEETTGAIVRKIRGGGEKR